MHQGPLKSQDFVFLRELSRSAHGGVHLARHRASGTPVAIKERRVPELGHGRDLMQEYKVLSTVRHPSVVRCLGHYWGDAGRRALFLVLELADAGDLHTEIRRRRAMRRHFDASTMWSLFSQICAGVAHLHSKGVVHRDIKSLNILLFDGEQGKLHAKLGDLGVSRVMDEEDHVLTTLIGTPLYLSPELCQRRGYTRKTDIWSLGVVLYEMATLRHPFEGTSVASLSQSIVSGRYTPVAPPATDAERTARVVGAMLNPEARDRPEAAGVLRWLGELGAWPRRGEPRVSSPMAAPHRPPTAPARHRARSWGKPSHLLSGAEAQGEPHPGRAALPAHGRALPVPSLSQHFVRPQGQPRRRRVYPSVPAPVPAPGSVPAADPSSPQLPPHSAAAPPTGVVRVIRVRRQRPEPGAEAAGVIRSRAGSAEDEAASDDSDKTLPGPGDEEAAARFEQRATVSSGLRRRRARARPLTAGSCARPPYVVIGAPTRIARHVEEVRPPPYTLSCATLDFDSAAQLRRESERRREERDKEFVPFRPHRDWGDPPEAQPPQRPHRQPQGAVLAGPHGQGVESPDHAGHALGREGMPALPKRPTTSRDRRWLQRREARRARARARAQGHDKAMPVG